MTWLAIVPAAYVLTGLAVLTYFQVVGWPDQGQALPITSGLVCLAFLPSYLLWLGGRWLLAWAGLIESYPPD